MANALVYTLQDRNVVHCLACFFVRSSVCSFVQLSAGLWEKTSDRHVTVGKLWALLQSTNRVLVPRRTVTTTTRNDDSAVIKETFNYSFNKDIRFYITFQLSNFTVSFSQFWHIDPPPPMHVNFTSWTWDQDPKGWLIRFFFNVNTVINVTQTRKRNACMEPRRFDIDIFKFKEKNLK